MAETQSNNRVVFALISSLFLMVGACSESPEPSDIEVGCRLNSDCSAGQVCDEGQCVDSDICEGIDCPCFADGDCAGGLLCDSGLGQCFEPECAGDAFCGLSEVCLSGRCEADVDADRDLDGVPDAEDSCPFDDNADQQDNDRDGQGDVCDLDDDNDAIPDTVDNCPTVFNPLQGDADNNGVGNACDAEVAGTTIEGTVDFSAGGNPNTELAQIFMTGVDDAVEIDGQGHFRFVEGLREPERFSITVVFEGFVTVDRIFDASASNAQTLNVGTIVLQTEADTPELAATMRGRARLQGGQEHGGILVEARIGAQAVAQAVTNAEGSYVMTASRVDHTLVFSSPGFIEETLEVVWNNTEAGFEADDEALENFEGIALRPDRSAEFSGTLTSTIDIQDWDARARTARLVGAEGETPLVVESDGDLASSAPVQPGIYGMELDIRGFLPVSRVVILGEGDNPQGDIELLPERQDNEAAQTMTGTVCLDDCDDPDIDHSGTVVRAVAGLNLVAVVVTDTRGQFTLRTSGEAHELELSHTGHGTEIRNVVFSDERQQFLLAGEPLSDAPIILQPTRDAAIDGRLSSPIEGVDLSAAVVVLVDDVVRRVIDVEPNGTFGRDALPSGLVGLEIDVEGHELIRRFVTLESGANSLGTIELTPVEVSMLGKVVTIVDDVEVPLEGVAVRLRRGERLVDSATSDTRGEFVFPAVLPLSHSLSLNADNFLPLTIGVEYDGQDFTLDGLTLSPDRPLVMVRTPESDRDSDGTIDILDNCPETFNPDLRDIDGDGLGDACDNDADGDGMFNGLDNCPFSHNPMQEDPDGDGRGLACAGGTPNAPLALNFGVTRQVLNLRERLDLRQGTCGGADAPEVAYRLPVLDANPVSVRVNAGHPIVLYLIDEQDREVGCFLGGELEIPGDIALPQGMYKLVVDGLTSTNLTGAIEVDITIGRATRFEDPIVLAIGDDPTAVTLSDINRDGHLDILAANRERGDVSVRLGIGDGTFADETSFAADNRPLTVSLADANDDSHLDLFVGGIDRSVMVLLGDGTGAFGAASEFSVNNQASTVVLEDINEDGHLDIIAGTPFGDFISILHGDGQGGFERLSTQTGPGPTSLVLADFNEDGHLDLANTNSTSLGGISVKIGQGQGLFEGEHNTFATGPNPTEISAGDLNEDGHLDIVTGNINANTVSVLLGDGQGGFLPEETFLTNDHQVQSAGLGDVDGDGHLDIVASNLTRTVVLKGNGLGDFAAAEDLPTVGFKQRSIALGDLNGDGLPDIVGIARLSGEVTVLMNSGARTLAPNETLAVDISGDQILVDIDGDGYTDLVTADSAADAPRVLRGNGTAGFTPMATLGSEPNPRSIAVGDLDGDGDLDIVHGSQGVASTVLAHLNDGQGGFETIFPASPIDQDPFKIALGDVDGDDFLDVVSANHRDNTISVLIGDGAGGFAPQVTFPVGNRPRALALGDIDNDDALDVLVVGDNDVVTVLLGDGLGGFTAGTDLVIGGLRAAISAVDVNSDGNLDAIITGGDVVIALGDGLGGFAPPTSHPERSFARESAIGDMNGDGHLDIVMALKQIGGGVGIRHGDGQGNFPDIQKHPFGNCSRMALGDIDNDGHLDALTTSANKSIVLTGMIQNDTTGTRLVKNTLPPCPPEAQTGLDLRFSPTSPCRVDRVELRVQGQERALRMRTPFGLIHRIEAPDAVTGNVWRPERVPDLARLESHPAAGLWRIEPGSGIDSVEMRVNVFPADPFDPDTLAQTCTADLDQSTDPEEICRLTDALDAVSLGALDEDVFLLEGPFSGAFVQGQIINITVTTEPGTPLLAELRAFRASGALAAAEDQGNGLWTLSFEIPPTFAGRYLAIHVRGNGVNNLSYDLSAGVE